MDGVGEIDRVLNGTIPSRGRLGSVIGGGLDNCFPPGARPGRRQPLVVRSHALNDARRLADLRSQSDRDGTVNREEEKWERNDRE